MQKFEHHSQPLLPLAKFIWRIGRRMLLSLTVLPAALFIGMLGYHVFEHLAWDDSFVNAAMILSGEGPVNPPATHAGKIFAGCYALFSGLTFASLLGYVFAPLLHRALHRLHGNHTPVSPS